MNFFNFFSTEEDQSKYGQLFEKLRKEYIEIPEEDLVLLSCIAGLLGRVAYADLRLDDSEIKKIEELIPKFNFGNNINPELITSITVNHIKDIAGLENHLYVQPLKSNLSKDQKYELLRVLFIIAASDGEVEGCEVEDIRLICKGLELSNQHFLAARAEVAEYLTALKNQK